MKSYKELLNIDLPKKIKLIITGDSIDSNKAMEIIRRTDAFFFGIHDKDLEYINEVRQLLRLPEIKEMKDFDGELLPFHEYEKKRRNKEQQYYKEHGIIKTEYVLNEWICPRNYIPVGWCHPDGTISFSGEVGDWPTVKEFLDDFIIISKTFSFLNMKASLVVDNRPLISFKIYDGHVIIIDPDTINFNLSETTESIEKDTISLEVIKEWSIL